VGGDWGGNLEQACERRTEERQAKRIEILKTVANKIALCYSMFMVPERMVSVHTHVPEAKNAGVYINQYEYPIV
jgi:hypothetical protein